MQESFCAIKKPKCDWSGKGLMQAASHSQNTKTAKIKEAYFFAQVDSPMDPGRQLSSETRRHTAGGCLSLPSKAAQMARSTSVYASLPLYCAPLMRMVGRMYTCRQPPFSQAHSTCRSPAALRAQCQLKVCAWQVAQAPKNDEWLAKKVVQPRMQGQGNLESGAVRHYMSLQKTPAI